MPSDRPRKLINEALAAIASGKNADALKLLDEADDLQPNNAKVFELRGIAFAQTGRAEAATESFRKAAAVEPSPKAFYNLAVHYYNIGESSSSLEAIKKCLTLDSNYDDAKKLLARYKGDGEEPQFVTEGRSIDPTKLAYKRRYGFGRKHLFAALAENQDQWVATGWTIVVLAIVSGIMLKIVFPFQAPSKLNEHDIMGGLRPIASPGAFATIAFFLTMVLASMIWTSLDLIDRRGKALWMIPMMLCCFACAPALPQALYMVVGRRDS